ncbi:DUF7701 domain-containing protein [Streptomyces rectiviolaceus]|uniref:DUF7701 domain-containing protein n=1 Tax=Streptomyces rectiviolaceus TaxID=332591 RepID=UPI003CD089A9
MPTSRRPRSTAEYSHPPERPDHHIGHARPGHFNKIVLRALRPKGEQLTEEDVHDAWSAWDAVGQQPPQGVGALPRF